MTPTPGRPPSVVPPRVQRSRLRTWRAVGALTFTLPALMIAAVAAFADHWTTAQSGAAVVVGIGALITARAQVHLARLYEHWDFQPAEEDDTR